MDGLVTNIALIAGVGGGGMGADYILLAGAAGLAVAGVLAARFTGRPWWFGAGRQLLLGAAAAGVTYLIGSAIGVGIG